MTTYSLRANIKADRTLPVPVSGNQRIVLIRTSMFAIVASAVLAAAPAWAGDPAAVEMIAQQDRAIAQYQPAIPVPDPTTLTRHQIEEVKAELTVQINDKIEALKNVIIARMDAKDKADVILADNVNRVPTLLDREIGSLTALIDVKISALQKIEEQDKIAAATAVSAALEAAKESVIAQNLTNAAESTKSEATTSKQIADLQALFSVQTNSTTDKIAAGNERLTRLEGLISSNQQFRENSRNDNGQTIAYISLGVAGVVAVFVVMGFFARGREHRSGD